METEEDRTNKVEGEYAAYDRKKVEKEVGPPPVFKTWNRLYGFILGFFAFLVILLYLFTKWFE